MPPVLTAPITWNKLRPSDKVRRSSDLTPEEMAYAKVALRVLRLRVGTIRQLATELSANPKTLAAALSKKGKPTAGLMLRAARIAGVPLEEILSGAWPKPNSCPRCGRS